MRKTFIIGFVIALVLGGLVLTMKARAPKPPLPTTQDIWAEVGIPVKTSRVIRGDMRRAVEVTGDINALDRVTLSAKIQGRVTSVRVREGDLVSAGMTVVQLDQEDALSNLQQAQGALEAATARLSQAKTSLKVTDIQSDAAIAQAQASLNAAEARLAVVKKPARSQEQMVAENNVASAKANLDNARSAYERNKKLVEQGAISQSAFEAVDAQYKVAQAQYKSAQEQLSLIKEGGRAEDVRQAQAAVDVAREQLRSAKANAAQSMLRKEDIRSATAALRQAQAGVALAKQQLANTYVKSPISGRVSSRLVEPGQVIAPGQGVAEVVNLGSLFFKGNVSEMALAGVDRGQEVDVSIDAIPGRTFTGVVDEIFPAGSTQSRNFPVRIGIRDSGGVIRPGMFARGDIVVGLDRGVMLVPKDAVEERRGTKIVFTVEPAKPAEASKKTSVAAYVVKRHNIEVVEENRDYVEVKTPTSLNVGDMVVTEGRQNLQDGLGVSIHNGKQQAGLIGD